jgi:HEAT repeat protein
MNSILLIVIVAVLLLLVFVMFSLDDQEDELDFLQEEENEEKVANEKKDAPEQPSQAASKKEPQPAELKAVASEQPTVNETQSTPKVEVASQPVQKTGSEEDLRMRIMLDQPMPAPSSTEPFEAVVAAVQLRFPEEVIASGESFLKLVRRAEEVFVKEFAFPFSCYPTTQLDRMLVFSRSPERDDELFEALVVAFEIVSRFKKTLEKDSVLQNAKARVSIGLSRGEMLRVNRGIAGEPSWVGKALYMAETLAEAAGDFNIYVDEKVHKAALPLFDFREWKPIKMRSPLPALPLFELVGWNKPEEIASFASHEDAFARRAVAVAYRYLELDDMDQAMLKLLTDPDEKVALEALETVKVIGSSHALGLLKRIFPETVAADFRSAIIDAFAAIGKKEVVPVILGSTKEDSWKVRLSAARALYSLSGKDALKHLEHMLDDSDSSVKAVVNGIFYRETNNSQYIDALRELLGDLSVRARKYAAEELLNMQSDKYLKMVIDRFADQEKELQKYILGKLEMSKSKILYQCFLTIFKNSGEKIRPHIVEAVRRAGLVS